MTPDRDAAAGRIARSQHGLITRRQALHVGFPPSSIQQQRATGRWETAERGVYLVSGAPRTWHSDLLAPCLAYEGMASHRATARLLHLDGFDLAGVELSVARGHRELRVEGTVHERLDFELARRTMRRIEGIPSTSPARLVADLGSVVPFPVYEAAVEELIRRKLLTWPAARASLRLHARRGRDGVGALRLVVGDRVDDHVGDSVLEARFHREGRRRMLPSAIPQHPIYDQQGFIARVDYAYVASRIAIELDSVTHHLTRAAFEDDRRKRNRLKLAGWLVLEFTTQMLREEPDVVFAQIGLALRQRAA